MNTLRSLEILSTVLTTTKTISNRGDPNTRPISRFGSPTAKGCGTQSFHSPTANPSPSPRSHPSAPDVAGTQKAAPPCMLYPATKLRPLAMPGLAASTIKVRGALSLGNGVATVDSCFSSFRGLAVGFWAAAAAPFPRALAHRCCGGPQGEQPTCSGWRCPEQSGRRWRAAPRRARGERRARSGIG
jgi:hypothetical protein